MRAVRVDWTVVGLVALAFGLTLSFDAIPSWMRFIGELAIAAALASVGTLLLLRAGLLSFGQSLFYFVGAYAVALLNKHMGLTDVFAAILMGASCAGVLAFAIGFFIARYRGIFFAMLTLALSMIAYGIAIKLPLFGRSDGLNVGAVTFFGYRLRGPDLQYAVFLLCVWTWTIFGILAHLILRSRLGKVIGAVEDNEIRLEYLGHSVHGTIHITYVVAAILASVGGSLAAVVSRHVDPNFAYWTTAGDFVFVVLLGGQAGVLNPLLGAVALEGLRTFASAAFPEQWQFVLGATMLAIIIFLPAGLCSPLAPAVRRWRRSWIRPVPPNPAT